MLLLLLPPLSREILTIFTPPDEGRAQWPGDGDRESR